MCTETTPADLSRSRFRWYDLPAHLFGHRAVRCRICGKRLFTSKKRKAVRTFSHLWMHYALLLTLILLGIGLTQQITNRW